MPSLAHPALGTSRTVRNFLFRRTPLRGLRKTGVVAGKRKSTRLRECFFLTGNYLSSQAASSQVLSAYVGLTAVFEMGTGGTPQLSSPDYLTEFAFACSLKTPHRKKIDYLRSRSSSLSLRTKRLTPFSCAVRGSLAYKSSPRPISTSPLKRLLALHSWPIYLIVYEGPYQIESVRDLILRLVSRLDAFSVYPFRT